MADIVEKLRDNLRPHPATLLRNADLAEAANVIERLCSVIHEVLTNGRWTEGEQRGEWAISQEVYATAQEAVDGLNIHKHGGE